MLFFKSHYSLAKSCALLGIGKDNLIKIKCDDNGCMDVAHLEQLLNSTSTKIYKQSLKNQHNGVNDTNGYKNHIEEYNGDNFRLPIMVNATAGTTVRGAFDDLDKIADVCERFNIWMHVDVSKYNINLSIY